MNRDDFQKQAQGRTRKYTYELPPPDSETEPRPDSETEPPPPADSERGPPPFDFQPPCEGRILFIRRVVIVVRHGGIDAVSLLVGMVFFLALALVVLQKTLETGENERRKCA